MMSLMESILLSVVVLAAVYFLVLGLMSLAVPDRASRFLLGFAGSQAKHYAEMLIRLIVGAAFVLRAPEMRFPEAFHAAGWVVIVTTVCLLLVPWRWHRRFAQRSVPQAVRYIRWIGAASLVLGGVILWAALANGAA
jgi:uncharacterized protein YjeT (DUF2065 family)